MKTKTIIRGAPPVRDGPFFSTARFYFAHILSALSLSLLSLASAHLH